MKVIFLDIDGVLNHNRTRDRVGGFLGLNPELIRRFNRIIDACPDVKVVVSSTWRYCYAAGVYRDFAGLVGLLKSRGLQGDIIGHTPFPVSAGGGWSLGSSYRSRGNEIRDYLSSHPEVERFVVLDDDSSGMKPDMKPVWVEAEKNYKTKPTQVDLRPHWIRTSGQNGLKEIHVQRAIRMLS